MKNICKKALTVLMLGLLAGSLFGCSTMSGVSAPANVQKALRTNMESAVFQGSLPQMEALCDARGTYQDNSGNTINYVYNLPKITSLNTPYVVQINAELENLYNTYVQPELQNIKAKNSLGYTKICYRAANVQGINSLLVTLYGPCDDYTYFCYNFDDLGNPVDNTELLQAAGFTEDTFINAAFAAADHYTYIDAATLAQANMTDPYNNVRSATLNSSNIHKDMPLCLNTFGRLEMICRVYALAGASYYDHKFTLLPPNTGFDPKELCVMSLNHYEDRTGYRPNNFGYSVDDKGIVTIQLYDSFSDHNSTADWYEVDINTGRGQNFTGDILDVTVQ